MLLAALLPYCFGFLNAYPDRASIPDAEAQEIQKGHRAHMGRMAKAGHLLASGPLFTEGGPRGLLVYRCDSVAQAEEWTKIDPAVINKRLKIEMYRWQATGVWGEPYATKAKADPDYKYEMVQLPFTILMKTARGAAPQSVVDAQRTYMEHLMKTGKVRSFGEFEGSADKLGLVVFAAMSLEQARATAEAGPLARGGWATVVAHEWYVADETVPRE
ncbi:MAG: YciI family protein [Bryobacteraceae bacterium]